MPTTVKSLEERLDEFSADVLSRLDTLESTVELIVRKVEVLSGKMGIFAIAVDACVKKIEDVNIKVDSFRFEFAEFRGKVDATLAMVKWVGATAVVAAITVIIAAFSVARSAGNLEATVQNQQKMLEEINKKLSDVRKSP